ncbi:MAG: alpha/beta hydrolase-fold protein [Saprospiraceae bacterium]
MIQKGILLFFFFSVVFSLFGQWTILLTEIPTNTPPNQTMYIAGTFNSWNPGNTSYALKKDSLGRWNITLNVAPGTYQFKFTRGAWASVEGTADGKAIGNRSYQYSGGNKILELKIAGWEDVAGDGNSTASPQVSILKESFFIPQLNVNRKIWLYLPKDYHTSSKNYPVIYMHDGQNLFDKKTSFLNEWKVDESLDSLFNLGDYGCIVIGIENGGASRISEYTPWPNPSYGGGKGKEYVQFIVETLKPYVDSLYRTFREPEYTAIAGSSLGGLISHYGGVVEQKTFGKIGSLSTSFWFTPDIYTIVSTTGITDKTDFYLSTGSDEGQTQALDMLRMVDTLKGAGASDEQLNSRVIQGGKHNENLWAREFPLMYQWFWKDATFTSNSHSPTNESPVFKVARIGDSLTIQKPIEGNFQFQCFTLSGQLLFQGVLEEKIQLPTSTQNKLLLFTILQNNQHIYTVKVP